jgi:ABC-type glycerol-3-phosphate transport system permease component
MATNTAREVSRFPPKLTPGTHLLTNVRHVFEAVIVPAAANAFGIFWMRQYIGGAVPDELLDASFLDDADSCASTGTWLCRQSVRGRPS